MSISKPRTLIALAIGLLLLVSACGDDDAGGGDPGVEGAAISDSTDTGEAELIEALMADALREPDPEFDAVSPEARENAVEMTRCLTAAMVSVVGVDALAEAGVTVQALQDADHEEILEEIDLEEHEGEIGVLMSECVDLVGMFRLFGEQDGLDPEVAQCFAEGALAVDGMEELLRSNLANDAAEESSPDQDAAMEAVLLTCMDGG